ncbi:MAG: alginate export family protein [Bdellovibrionota bacterium]|nr:MAG: alginate export family protein [Bdellovibrionota bacterium]
MRRFLHFSHYSLISAFLVAAPFAASISHVVAEERHELAPGVSVGGSLRTRFEYKYDFKFDDQAPGNTDNFFLSQIRLNVLWKMSDQFSAFIEGQDAGIQGDDAVDEDATPNIYNDRFDLHQAYLDYAPGAQDTALGLRVGRQKLKYGEERLVGPLEWVNTARVFDAMKATIGRPSERSADVFASRVVAVDPDDWNDWADTPSRYANSQFYGTYYTDKQLLDGSTLEGYYLLRYEDDAEDEVHTVGGRFLTAISRFSIDGDGSYQFGRFGGLDHSAFATHLGTAYTFDPQTKTKLGVAYNYASGDDDQNDSDHETFDNLFPTNHAFYGYMDFFSLQNMHNLELAFSSAPLEDLELRIAWQNFWLAEEDSDSWYNAGLGTVRTPNGTDNDSYVGSELDITATYPLWEKKLGLLVGYSHFFADNYVEDTGPSKDADYVYFQAKLTL